MKSFNYLRESFPPLVPPARRDTTCKCSAASQVEGSQVLASVLRGVGRERNVANSLEKPTERELTDSPSSVPELESNQRPKANPNQFKSELLMQLIRVSIQRV